MSLQPTFSINTAKSKHLRKWLEQCGDVSTDTRKAIATLIVHSSSFAVHDLNRFLTSFEDSFVHCERFFSFSSMEASYTQRLNGKSLAHYVAYLEAHGNFPPHKSLGYVV